MQKINVSDINLFKTAGIYCEQGYIPGNSNDIIIQGRNGWFLVSKNDFEYSGRNCIRPNDNILQFIGGLGVSFKFIQKIKKHHHITQYTACSF